MSLLFRLFILLVTFGTFHLDIIQICKYVLGIKQLCNLSLLCFDVDLILVHHTH